MWLSNDVRQIPPHTPTGMLLLRQWLGDSWIPVYRKLWYSVQTEAGERSRVMRTKGAPDATHCRDANSVCRRAPCDPRMAGVPLHAQTVELARVRRRSRDQRLRTRLPVPCRLRSV